MGEPLFPEAAGELSRFVLLRIPGIGFEELGANPFDPASDLAEGLGAAAAEPDVAVAAEPGPESEILGCWVGGARRPTACGPRASCARRQPGRSPKRQDGQRAEKQS